MNTYAAFDSKRSMRRGAVAPRAGLAAPLLVAVAVLVAAIFGLGAAFLPPIAIAFLAALLLGAALVTRPVLLLWLTVFATLFVAGTVKYFLTGFDRIWWAGYGLAAAMYVPALLHLLTVQRRQRIRVQQPPTRTLGLLLTLFLALILISSVVNAVPLAQFAAAAKSWLLYGGLIALFATVPVRRETVHRLGVALLALASVQILPVVYQFVFVRGRRLDLGIGATAAEASDSVVGTFGGSMEGGGQSAVLALFLCITTAYVLLARQRGVISRPLSACLVVLMTVPLLLMEVKVVFVYLPIVLLYVYRRALVRNPLGFIVGALVVIALGTGGLFTYQAVHWERTGRTLAGNLEKTFSYSFDEEASIERYRAGVMTRREALEYWWQRHDSGTPIPALFGHGFGAARTTGLTLGTAALPHWPRRIDATGASSLLWELGVLGTAMVVALLVSGSAACGRMARAVVLQPWQRALAGSLQLLLALAALSLPYRNDVPYAAPMMCLVLGGLGLTFWLGREVQAGESRLQRGEG